MRSRELLAAATAGHRRQVARELGLAATATPDEIAAAVAEAPRLLRTIRSVEPETRGILAWLAFVQPVVPGDQYAWQSPLGGEPLVELERRGLVHAFESRWELLYRMADDLRQPLRRLFGGIASLALRPRSARRWMAVPLQTAHDSAAVWMSLGRSPARLKNDGEPYKKVLPQLEKALPALPDGLSGDGLGAMRVELALRTLRAGGHLRVRLDDRPGASERLDLLPQGDLLATVGRPAGELSQLLLAQCDDLPCLVALSVLAAAREPGTDLASLGAAMRGLLDDIDLMLPDGLDDLALGHVGIWAPWLAGTVELGADAKGMTVAVRMSADRAGPPTTERLGVCQSDFAVVLLRPPTPAERLALLLLADPEPGQAHVMRLSRTSVVGPGQAGLTAGDPVERLAALVGEVPQNVAASLRDWASGEAAPVRLRSALFIDVGDPAAADRLVAGPLARLAVERLGPSAIAVRASEVEAASRALAGAGFALEPGLDRISGTWTEPRRASPSAELRWRPAPAWDESPAGRHVSSIDPGGQAVKRRQRPAYERWR